MKRYGMVIGLRPEKIEEYRQLHAAAWPDVLKMITECNIRNYSIYLRQLDDPTLVVLLQALSEGRRKPRARRMVGQHGRGIPLRLTPTNSWIERR